MSNKKIDKLNLKSTNYGSGVATNTPLDVKDFEKNFVTLADAINDNSDNLDELGKESAVIKGRVDALKATKAIKLIGSKTGLNLNPDTETFDYVNVNYRDADDKKLTLDFLDHEICYEVTAEGTGFSGTLIEDENNSELFSISKSSSETPSTGAIVSINTPTSINYANQSVRFVDSNQGKVNPLTVDISFDELGQVISYTIIEAGSGYSANDKIPTNDILLEDGNGMTYDGGSIELTVSEITKGKTKYTFYMSQAGNYSVKLLKDFDGDGDSEWSESISMTRKYGIFNGQTLGFTASDAGETNNYTLILNSLTENTSANADYDYQLKVEAGSFDIRNAQSLFLESMIGDTLSAGDYSMSIVKAGSVIADNDEYIEFDNSGLYIITDIVMANPTNEISSASGGLFTSTPRNSGVMNQAQGQAPFLSSIVAITSDLEAGNADDRDQLDRQIPRPASAAATKPGVGIAKGSGLTALFSSTSYINTQVGGGVSSTSSPNTGPATVDNQVSTREEATMELGGIVKYPSLSTGGGILLVGNSLVQNGLYFNLENVEGSEAYCDVYVFGFLIGESNSDSGGDFEPGPAAPPLSR